MRDLTKEEYDILKLYETQFDDAVNRQMSRGCLKGQFETLLKIYEDVTNNKSGLNYNCSYCVIKLFTNLGKIYYERKEREGNAATEETKGNSGRNRKS